MIALEEIPWRLIMRAAAAAAFVAVLAFAGCQHQRAENEVVKRLSIESQLDQVVDVNKSNMITIARQNDALNQWAEIGMSPAQVKALVLDALRAVQAADKALAEMARAKETDRADPDCAEVLGQSIERRCPGVVRRLRELAAGSADSDRGDPRAGGHTTAQGDHGGLRPAVSIPSH